MLSCGDGYYTEKSQPGVCTKCDARCKTCKTKEYCVSCNSKYFLSPNGTCVKECTSGYLTSLDDINSQYELIEDDDISYPYIECNDCHQSCKNCSGPGDDACISCKIGLGLNIKTKSCHPCDPGRYFDATITINQCQNCHNECDLCHGPTIEECDKCKLPLARDKWNKTCVPCCGSTQKALNHKIPQKNILEHMPTSSFSSTPLSTSLKSEAIVTYCCECNKHHACVSPAFEEKPDDASGKRSILIGNVELTSMASSSRKTLMLVSFLVILCFISFVIFKRCKREKRRRKGQVNGKRKHLAEQLVKLFSTSRDRKNGGHKNHRNGGLYAYSQVPTNSLRNTHTMGSLEDIEDSEDSVDDFEYEQVGRRNCARTMHALYLNDNKDNTDNIKLIPSANSNLNRNGNIFEKI